MNPFRQNQNLTREIVYLNGVVLASLVFIILLASTAQPEDIVYPSARLKIGDKIPSLQFKDVYGFQFSNENFEDWIIVYSFADRLSHKPFQSIIGPAGIEVVKAHPELKIVYIGIADLLMVPTMFAGIVTPILKHIMDNNNNSLEEAYKIWRVPLEYEKTRFYMVPDFSGHLLHTFGLKNARQYHVFVVYRSKIHAIFDPFNPPYVDDYMPVFDKLSNLISPHPQTGSEKKD